MVVDYGVCIMNELEKQKDVIRMLEADKRLLYRNIVKLRKDVKALKKEIEEKNKKIDYLDELVRMKQMTVFDYGVD